MALMKNEDFTRMTARTKIAGVYTGGGKHIARVAEALRTYHDHFQPNAPLAVREGLLYNVWKECLKWLKVKAEKLEKADDTGEIGKVLKRRKNAVQVLRDEALRDLAQISPGLERALQHHQTRKTAT